MQNDVDDQEQPEPPGEGTTLQNVRQDKRADANAREPQNTLLGIRADEKPRRAQRQTVQLTLWVYPSVKAELERIAETGGLSLSRAGAAALEEWLVQRVQMEYSAILQARFEQAIAKQMRAYNRRIATLLARSIFSSEQTRVLVINFIGRQLGLTKEALYEMRDESVETAKRNVTRVTPQLETLIQEIEHWLEQRA